MPNWMDYLTEPLVPEAPVRRLQEQIDAPELERSPWEARLRGFGAGALEGLRGLSSPMALAGMLPAGRLATTAARGAQGLSRAIPAAARAFDMVDTPGVTQMLPDAGDADALVGALRYGLAKAPQGSARQLGAQLPIHPSFPSSPPSPMPGLNRMQGFRQLSPDDMAEWYRANPMGAGRMTGQFEPGPGGLSALEALRGTVWPR